MRNYTLDEALAVIGLTKTELDHEVYTKHPQPDQHKQRCQAYTETILKAYKKTILKYHPDRCKDIDAEEKAKEINFIKGELMKITPMPPHPPVQHFVIFNQSFGGFSTSTTSTTTASWSPFGNVVYYDV